MSRACRQVHKSRYSQYLSEYSEISSPELLIFLIEASIVISPLDRELGAASSARSKIKDMKIRVLDSDGKYRGGLFNTVVYDATNCRVWHAPPNPNYLEKMIDISGFNKPSYPGSWFMLRISKADIEDADRQGTNDYFAENSQAINLTPVETIRWFERNGFEPPEDLLDLEPNHADATTISESKGDLPVPRTDAQQEILDLLDGNIYMAKELAKLVNGGPISEAAVRKRIEAINKSELVIINRPGRGYYLLDAPPESG